VNSNEFNYRLAIVFLEAIWGARAFRMDRMEKEGISLVLALIASAESDIKSRVEKKRLWLLSLK
jgi:hypothetical protein